MEENKIGVLKMVLTATAAQLLASAAFIFFMESYSKWHQGKEAWPVLFPALAIAFGLETLLLFLVLKIQKGAAFLSVLLSWFAGLASFLVLDVFARPQANQAAPVFSWLIGLASLSIMIKRLRR